MADVYKQSFKQNYTNNIELSIFNCGIERCGGSAPAAAYDSRSRLERHALPARVERPVHERAHSSADSCVVHRRTENVPVSLCRFEYELIHNVVDTALAQTLLAGSAADTAGYRLAAYPEYLGMYSLLLKHGSSVLQRGVGAAVLVWAAIY